jgi:capsular exopolysaccharide synthesis family protein
LTSSKVDLEKNLITYSNTDSIISDQFRTIRTNIKFLAKEKPNKILLITSPGKGEGKTISIANLAVSIAQQKESVLLIDANLRKPAIHHIFKTSNDAGLADLILERSELEETIHKPGIGGLDVITSGITSHNPAEILGSESMQDLLNNAAAEYDIVLIDAPNLLDSTETRILANQADGVILVLHRGKTELNAAVEAKKILDLAQAQLLGTIINEK